MLDEQPSTSSMPEPRSHRLEPAQKELKEELARLAAPLADLYEAAVFFASNLGFPARAQLLAHAVREIANSLPDALEETSDGGYFNWKGCLREIQTQWKMLGMEDHYQDNRTLPGTEPPDVPLAWQLYTQIRQMLIEFRASDERVIDKATRVFRNLAPELLAPHGGQRPILSEWQKLIGWFQGITHDPRKGDTITASQDDLQDQFAHFENLLRFLLPRLGVVQALDEIDNILCEANRRAFTKPTEDQVDWAIRKLNRPIVRRHFFDKLENPEWLQPLRRRGLFSSPPDIDAETGACPQWPEARYLVRMAPARPDDFVEILNEMKPTKNASVVVHLLKGLLAIPPAASARAVPVVAQWLEARAVLFPDAVTKLVVRLAENGLPGSALELARCFLQVLPDPDRNRKRRRPVAFLCARALMDTRRYDEECRKLVPALTRAAGVEAVRLFVELLARAMDYEGNSPGTGRTDLSHIYRPDIEQACFPGHSVVDALIDALRESVLTVLDQRPEEGQSALEAVSSGPSRVFDRIELYVLSKHPHPYMQRITELVRDFEDFDDLDARREFRILLHVVFAGLPPELRDRYLKWVDTQPDLEAERKSLEEFTGKPVSEEDVRKSHRQRTFWRLRPIKEYLQGEWRRRYEQLADDFQEPAFPEEAEAPQVSGVGWQSPISEEELLDKPVPQVVQYLSNWKPPGEHEWEGPSREGLSKALSAVVEKAASDYAVHAQLFTKVLSCYVCALLSGLQKACTAGTAFDWMPVLKLCQWTVEQPYEEDSDERFEAEPKWGWARSAAMELLRAGLESEAASIPLELRDQVWDVIQPITRDRDPTPAGEARNIRGHNDPLTVSLNTRRGQAMHTVMRYALWCRRDFEGRPDTDELKAAGFDAMPEVREALEQHLDLKVEPSLALRSVYGRWYPWIAMLDSRWARANTDRIFPKETEAHWEAAWDAYVLSCPLYTGIYEGLSEHYALAVERLARGEEERILPGNSAMSLIGHLLRLYGMGKLDLRGGLFERFWQIAPAELREHAFASIGHEFRENVPEEDEEAARCTVPSDVMGRVQALCKYRIEAASTGDPAFAEELSGFGYWFDKKEFDGAWALSCLKRILSLRGGKVQNVRHVLERLVELREANPGDVLFCLRKMIVGGSYDYAYWMDFVEDIIRNCLSHADPSIRQTASNIASVLIGLGHLQFRDMLPQ